MIYLDNASTTWVDEECIKVVTEDLGRFGNPSNNYWLGSYGKKVIKEAKEKISGVIGCKPNEVYFTSGASEGNAWAISQRKRTYCSEYEHHNYLDNPNIIRCDIGYLKECLAIEKRFGVGMYNDCGFAHMLVSNETGERFEVEEYFKIAKELGMFTICDCTQAFGNCEVNVKELGCDMAVFSGHKFHAPKGIGFVYIKEGVKVKPMICGTQQSGLRGGTENVPYIHALGIAAEKYGSVESIDKKDENGRVLREEIKKILDQEGVDYIDTLHWYVANKGLGYVKNIGSTFSICLSGVESEVLQMILSDKDIFIGTGSACTDGSMKKNTTLELMGIPDEYIRGNIRFSFTGETKIEEVREAVKELCNAYKELKHE